MSPVQWYLMLAYALYTRREGGEEKDDLDTACYSTPSIPIPTFPPKKHKSRHIFFQSLPARVLDMMKAHIHFQLG